MGWLALLFIVVPAVELALLIEVGTRIGALSTFALIVVTGMVGAALAKRAGLDVMARIRSQTQAGQLPTGALVDGAIILLAGALLVTPGIVTDVFGFACLVPGFRHLMKRGAIRYFERAVGRGQIQTFGGGVPPGFGGPPNFGGGPGGPGFGGPQGFGRRPDEGGPVIDVSPDSPDRH